MVDGALSGQGVGQGQSWSPGLGYWPWIYCQSLTLSWPRLSRGKSLALSVRSLSALPF